MRILITGGAGFIGSNLAQRLARDGHSVVIFDNFLPQVHGPAPQIDLSEFEVIKGDVRNPDEVAQAIKGVGVVYHLAAETGVGQSQYEVQRYVATNTYGTAVVLEAAVTAKVRQVIISSSRAVYGEGPQWCPRCRQIFNGRGRQSEHMAAGQWNIVCPQCNLPAESQAMVEDTQTAPTSIYGLTKLQQEQLAFTINAIHGLPVTVLRFFNVFGPGQSLRNPYVGVLGTFFRRVVAKEAAEIYEDGEMLRDFVFVDDAVEALRLSNGNERAFGQVFNVGTGSAVTLLEAGKEMFRALAREPNLHISGRYRVGDVRHAVADPGRLFSTLDFRPQISFAEGLKRYVEWALVHQEPAADRSADDLLVTHNLLRQGGR